MLEFDENKMIDIVYDEMMRDRNIKWHRDKDGNLLSITFNDEVSTFRLFWFDIGQLHYCVLFDSRTQRLYIKDETQMRGLHELFAEVIRTMIKMRFGEYRSYRSVIKLTDNFERMNK